MSLKGLLPLVIFIVVGLLAPSSRGEELNVFFKTTPRQELLRPFADPVELSLLITDGGGRPVQQGTVAIRLDAPRPGRFFSTDFPLVEGTLLNEMRLPLRQGRVHWKQLFPIRGEYRLTVDVAAEGIKARKAFTFDVHENRTKWLALAAFLAALFVLGVVAGRVFTGARAGLATLILVTAIFGGSTGRAGAQQSQPARSAVLEIEPATVGRPAVVRWRLTDAGSTGGRAAVLSLTITHLEKQKTVFAVEKIEVPGEWSMKFHFPDGAAYRVAAVGNVQGSPPLRNEQVVTVTGVEPPASAMIPALAFFTMVIALGLGVGRWSKHRSAAR